MLQALAFLILATPSFDFYTNRPYDAAVPRPEAVLGYAPGERHTTFRDQERVLSAIAASAPGSVKVIDYGKSVEGRPLKILVISSPENIGRLPVIRAKWDALALGKLTQTEASRMIEETPALVWINETIHGNESASFESGIWLAYTLAASRSERLASLLSDVVVIINPVYNPDGHERFVVWYNSVATGSSSPDAFEQREPSVIHGRTNHYRFDMNRDRVSFSQVETRQEVAEYLKWNPHVYADQHGEVGTYFFPPNSMSVNANVDRKRFNLWTEVFGRGNARAFDQQGWQYFIRDTFDFFAAGYLDTYAAFLGAIAFTYETDGGGVLAREREDGSILTLRDGMAKHFVTALATIETAAANRKALLESYAKFRRDAASGASFGKFQRVVLTSPDPRPLVRLQTHLKLMGVESRFAAKDFSQRDAHDYWKAGKVEQTFPAGSLVIDMAQPQGTLAKSMLEPTAEFEPEFTEQQLKKREARKSEKYPGEEGADFYDTTAWCLVYAYNLPAWWCESARPIESSDGPRIASTFEDSPIGWALRYSDQEDVVAAFDLMASGVRAMSTTKPIESGGTTYARGTFLFLKGRNEDLRVKLERVSATRRVSFEALKTGLPDTGREGIGSPSVDSIKKPNVAIVFGGSDWLSGAGSLWYLMESEWKLPFTPITASALSRDLSKYTAIVFPEGRYGPPSEDLKGWIRAGGCAIVMDSVDWIVGEKGLVDLKQVDGKGEGVPGSFFRAKMEPRLFLTYGYADQTISAPVGGSNYFKAKKEGGGAVTFSGDEKEVKLLSGWSWPDETEKRLAGAVWAHDEPVGDGHVILFTVDPTYRAMWPGLYKLILNAMLFGPAN